MLKSITFIAALIMTVIITRKPKKGGNLIAPQENPRMTTTIPARCMYLRHKITPRRVENHGFPWKIMITDYYCPNILTIKCITNLCKWRTVKAIPVSVSVVVVSRLVLNYEEEAGNRFDQNVRKNMMFL